MISTETQPTLETETKDLVKEFSLALKNKDLETLSDLLLDKGRYEAQNRTLQIVPVNKQQFVNWLRFKLQTNTVETIYYDTCILCKTGNPVALYNDGKFPRIVKDMDLPSKAGFMFEIKENKITSIKFCYSLLKTENPKLVECKGKLIMQYMKEGHSLKEAIRMCDTMGD